MVRVAKLGTIFPHSTNQIIDLLLSFLKLPIMLSRTQQVPFFLQSKHSYIFSQSYNFLMDALEGYRIHQDQNNVSKGTRSTIRIHEIILMITTERLQL